MSHVQILQDVDILVDLSLAKLEKIAAIGETRTYSDGDVVFKENTHSTRLYIILNGMVEILINPATLGNGGADVVSLKTIATLRRGESFGEMALVDQGIRSASAVAMKDHTQLLIIPRDKFVELCKADFEMGYLVMRNIASDLALKLRQTDIMVREQILWGKD